MPTASNLKPWRAQKQAFLAIHYLQSPLAMWDITDMRQPQPCEIAILIRDQGQTVDTYHRVIALQTQYTTTGAGPGDFDGQTAIPVASWDTIAAEVAPWLDGLDLIVMHGEGRVIEAMRQLNALSIQQARLPMPRACTDNLSRLAGLRHLPRDRWGYAELGAAAEAAGIASHSRKGGALREVALMQGLFDWAHRQMDGMFCELALEAVSGEGRKRGPYPLTLPAVDRFTLEPYQGPAIEKSLAHAECGRGGLIIAPTGAGKTIISAIRNASLVHGEPGARGLVLAESPKILRQIRATYARLYPEINVTCCFAGEHDLSGDLVVASRQQLGVILELLKQQHFTFLDIDEAHHAASAQYREILALLKRRNSDLLVFGETATPRRADSKSLRPIFRQVTSLIRLQDVRRTGRIVDLNVISEESLTAQDLAAIQEITARKALPDTGALSEILNSPENNALIVRLHQEHAADRLTVVYAVDIAHAEGLLSAFRDAGVIADAVHSRDGRSTEKRETLLHAFAHGGVQVLINVLSLTEGWDCPPASCAIIARPANHPSILEQMVGRVLRASAGKQDALLIEVGVNKESLSQFLYQFVSPELAVEGVRVTTSRGGNAPGEGDSGVGQASDEAWIPPLLPLGDGWLGLSYSGRFMACRQTGLAEYGWLAIELRDPVTHAAPSLADVPELEELHHRLAYAWQRYREGLRSPKAGRPLLRKLHRWRLMMASAIGLRPRWHWRQETRELLDELRCHPVYRRLYGVSATRHPSTAAFIAWLTNVWLKDDELVEATAPLIRDFRSAPDDPGCQLTSRYHERLHDARRAVAGRLTRTQASMASIPCISSSQPQPGTGVQPSAGNSRGSTGNSKWVSRACAASG